MNIIQTIIILLTFSTLTISAERILVLMSHPGSSHFYSFYPLFNALAERGHNVTVLSYNHVKNHHKNYNELVLEGMPLLNIDFDTMVSNVKILSFMCKQRNVSDLFESSVATRSKHYHNACRIH